MKYYESRAARFFAGKGFYLVLAVCLLAVGVAAWSAVSSISTTPDTKSKVSYTESVSSYNEVSDEPAGKTVSNVSDERIESETSSAVENVSSTAPAATYYVLPATGDVLKGFSITELQYSATYGDSRIHNGVDILAEAGTEIKSAGEGTVLSTGNDALWGGAIEIDHGNGVTGIYYGIDSIAVAKGAVVHAGTVLGVLGTIPCESADQTHLHLAFKEKDEYVSPLELMDMEN